MATVREYFDNDSTNNLTVHTTWQWQQKAEQVEKTFDVFAKIAYDFEANAKYWYLYIQAGIDLASCLHSIFTSPELQNCRLRADGDGLYVAKRFADYSEHLTVDTLQFTKRVHLYLDFDGSAAERASLVAEALTRGYYLSIRDREYARRRSEAEKPLAFICHDTRDKDAFVRELARELLVKHSCFVWYDEYSLKVGDSLRDRVERGLKEARKCIMVLSPSFFTNSGWSKAEFDSIFTREIVESQNVMLPVWLNVDVKDVYSYSPRLADKVGLPASLGVAEVARRLALAVNAR